jgi:ATP-dependent helicase HrpA
LRYAELLAADRRAARATPGLAAFRWLLEELRVSLFAQELRTPVPVSFKRVEKAWSDLTRGR